MWSQARIVHAERYVKRAYRGRLVRSVTEIVDDVIHELRWDPQITHPDAIGVRVTAGAVVLGGYVWTCAQKLAAALAARRVPGVGVVINNTQIRPASLKSSSGAPESDFRSVR